MAASSSECGRQAAGLHPAAAEFGNAQNQRPGSAELYRQTGSLVGHRNDSLFSFFFELFLYYLTALVMLRLKRKILLELDREKRLKQG
jgi:hypothetical protein